nr:hypothetical protein [Allomuricauda sp.]
MKTTIVKSLALFGLLGFTLGASAQSVEEVLNKVTQFYKSTSNYSVEMEFSMLRGLSGNKITESYTASMERNGDYLKNEISGTSVFVFPEGQIIMDNNTKKITYSKAVNLANLTATFDMGLFLQHYKKSQLLDKGNHWICEMVTTHRNFSQLPYSKIELHINKEDYSISKQVLYFANLVPFHNKQSKTTEQDYGRMMIQLSHDFDAKVERREMSDFVTVLPNKELRLQAAYNNYQLVKETQHN